jgi:hypothetical protein
LIVGQRGGCVIGNNGYDPLQPLSIIEVSKILGRTPETIYKYIHIGDLRAIKRYEGQRRPQKYFVIRQDLEEFIYGKYNNYSGTK